MIKVYYCQKNLQSRQNSLSWKRNTQAYYHLVLFFWKLNYIFKMAQQKMQQTFQHTFLLESERKAVLQIPYSKFQSQSKTAQDSQSCCNQKFIITSSGSSSKTSNQSEMRSMMQELQRAYDKDVRQLKQNIDDLLASKVKIMRDNETVLKQTKDHYERLLLKSKQRVQQLQLQSKDKSITITKIKQQHEVLLRSKINQFYQSQYVSKIHSLEILLQRKDIEIKGFINKIEQLNIQKLKNGQALDSSKQRYQAQVQLLTLQINRLTLNFSTQNDSLSKIYLSKEEQWRNTLNKKQSELDIQKTQIQKLKGYLEGKASKEEENTLKLQENKQEIDLYKSNIYENHSQIVQLKGQLEKYQSFQYENIVLKEKLLQDDQVIYSLSSENSKLLLELSQQYKEIQLLKISLNKQEKVYQIRVEKVIKNKEELDKYKYSVFQMTEQINQGKAEAQYLREQISKRQRHASELISQANAYKLEISQLKLYIETKEKGFKWAVQRQIQQDMKWSGNGEHVYKVSQVRQYVRNVQQQRFNKLSEKFTVNIQEQIFGNDPNVINFTNNQPSNQ